MEKIGVETKLLVLILLHVIILLKAQVYLLTGIMVKQKTICLLLLQNVIL